MKTLQRGKRASAVTQPDSPGQNESSSLQSFGAGVARRSLVCLWLVCRHGCNVTMQAFRVGVSIFFRFVNPLPLLLKRFEHVV